MRSFGGNMSHRKHRSGAFGGPKRGHRTEVARILAEKPKGRAQRMYGSVKELMRGRVAER